MNGSSGPEANIQPAIQDNSRVKRGEAYHLCSQYFTTQGSNRNTALGKRAASEPRQRKLSKTQCHVSTDGTLKCPPLYCKKVVMYSKAQGAEQKQEGKGMHIP